MLNIPTKVTNISKAKIVIINFFLNRKRIFVPLLFIFLFLIFYFFIDFSSQNLVAHDEGLYARRSRLLEESYNWFSPPFSTPHHKTLGSYWFIALSIRLFGNSELALRLPSILASIVCLFISYYIALRITNKKAALISVFSLSSMPLWIQYSRYASPDIIFVLCVLLVILFFLNFLDNKSNVKNFIYIFFSGFFISIAFFIRSYMIFVPLIGLAPFLGFHLFRARTIFKSLFLSGILFGSLPTLISLIFAYKKFGNRAISSLFDFVEKQAIGNLDFSTYYYAPINFLYLTFPIGIILVILIVFTYSNNLVKYPLLIYFYPILSTSILLFMTTSYPHYFLFLLPSLAIIFGNKIQSFSFRFYFSKFTIKYLLSFLLILITLILVLFLIYFNDYFLDFSYTQKILVYSLSLVLILSYISSIRFLFNISNNQINLIKVFYNLIIPQYISLSLFFNFGILGNPNYKTKEFLKDKVINSIISSNTIYLFQVDSKIQTLLSFYLPSSKVVNKLEDIRIDDYIITNNSITLNILNGKKVFKSIRKFDNHFLLMKKQK